MPGEFDQRVAVITGAGNGIGRGAALVLAGKGARVAVVDIDQSAAEQTCALIRSKSGEALAVQADVSSASAVKQMAAVVSEAWGRLDILVNNAGILRYGTVTDTDEQAWDALLAVDLKGAFLCSKYAVPEMRRQGGGAIVNVSSALALVAFPRHAAYCAAKAGVIGLTKAMALDHAREGIRVNCVCPGTIRTAMNEQNYDATALELIGQCHPLGRLGTPEEIGRTIAFLASEESAFLTGAVLVADGGLSSQLGPDLVSPDSPVRKALKNV